MKLAVGGAMAALAVVPLLPKDTLDRLMTFSTIKRDVSSYQQLDIAKGAVDSTEARTMLQKQALELTLRHPLFGVGPAMFADAIEVLVREKERRKSAWQVSHNSYLQVSSESGIPGLVFYVWVISLCFKLNYTAYRDGVRAGLTDMSLQSMALLLATAVYAFGIFFSSIAFNYHLAVIIGFTAANYRAWKQLSSHRLVHPAR
jgi:O-antigen ligase